MRYDYRIAELEAVGINYHKIFANWIREKLNQGHYSSILIVGEQDFLITYLLVRESVSSEYFHLWNEAGPETRMPRTRIVKPEDFKFEEYDIVIGLFVDKAFIEKCVKTGVKFILIPDGCNFINSREFKDIYEIFKKYSCPFTVTPLEGAFPRGRIAFSNL